jgi:hypothetical protein
MANVRAPALVRLTCLTALLLLAAGCETLQTGSDYDHAANFSGYHTFTIMQRPHRYVPNALIVQRTEDAIKSDLQSRGYVYVDDPAKADFTVDFTMGSQERTDVTSYPSAWAAAGAWGGPGWWGGPYWGNTVDVRQYQEGTLSVDVFDEKTRRPVWHGWAKKTLSQSDLEHSTEPINKAVAEVLKKFPPGRS